MLLRFITLLFLGMGFARPQSPAIPNTPAGRTMQAWLEAFNSGDRTRIQAYLAKYEPTKALDPQMVFREQTGGFQLISIDKSEPLQIEFRVKENSTRGTTAFGRIEVKDGDPAVVVAFLLRAIPPGVVPGAMQTTIDAATRARDGMRRPGRSMIEGL